MKIESTIGTQACAISRRILPFWHTLDAVRARQSPAPVPTGEWTLDKGKSQIHWKTIGFSGAISLLRS